MVKKIFRSIAVGSLIVSLILVWLLLRKPSIPSAEPSAEAAKSFNEKMARVAQAQELGTPTEVRLTEAEINSKIQEAFRSDPPPPVGPASFKEVTFHLEADKLRVLLTVNVKGVDLYMTLGGKLSSADHTVQLLPSEVRLGSLPIPVSWVKDRINARVELPEAVTVIRVENGEVVVAVR